MNDYQKELIRLFHEKGEYVINLPDWLLPPSKIKEIPTFNNPAIIELAGRDSVAAAIKAVELHGFTDLIPTYVFTGTESGPWSLIETSAARLASIISRARVHDLIVMGSSEFWRAVNGRFVDDLVHRYGFYTPCIGCHMYLHSLRLPLAASFGSIPIVSGERELHNEKVKINQTAGTLAAYSKVAESFGIELIFPLQHISDGKEIDKILGFEWEEGKDQPGCVLSGNYRKTDGSVRIDQDRIEKYLEEFLCPLTKKIIKSYISNVIPDHIKLAAETLESGSAI